MIKRWLHYPMSMRYRFMFVFFILIAVPFALVGYIALSKSEKTIHNSNLDSVVQTGKNLDNFFYYVRNEQDKIMASDEMQTLFNDELNDHIDEIDYANKLIAYTDTLNYANKLFKIRLFPLRPDEHPTYMKSAYDVVDLNHVPWFEDIVANGRSFWKVFGPEDHPSQFVQSTLGSVKRLHSLKTFQPLGIVVMEIRPSILAEFIYPVKQLDNQKLMLVNKNNEVIYSTDDKYVEIEDSLKPVLLDSQISKTMNYEGKSSLISASAVMDGELRLVSIVPLKDLNNPVAVLNKLTLAFLIFYFLLSIFLAGYLTVKYTSPISSLVRQMKVLARNNFKEDSLSSTNLVERSDEVGWLYRGMHNMIGEINKLLIETKESEKRKKQLEFQVLAYQINPHFLYNTLDTIRWKAEAHHIDEISEIVSSLGSLFRLSLNGGKEITNVRRELELLKAYVHIEKVRQSSLVRITYRIEEEILHLPFMRLVLQPLVENAIRHGIADKGDAGMILIQGGLEEHGICFRITDNGPGIPDEIRQTLLDPAAETRHGREGGLGLINVHERLRHYFGEAYGLEIESEINKGTTIVLWHPVLPEDITELDG
ncbi:sensor histidine kinase [Paenibacillus gorillae]|uniref:sensor histidine kinase n=1 Tax=Paenibacillus gorillae TaxID=1243662 RepID=UPI0004B8EADB|nr:sensor histidine kinase [Paenibacillus gorillae]